MRRVGWLIALAFVAPQGLAAEDWEPARTPWGAPDLNGFWDYGSMTPLERPEAFADKSHFTPEEARRFVADFDQFVDEVFQEFEGDSFVGPDLWLEYGLGIEPDLRTSLIVDPPNGKLPDLTTASEARQAARREERMQYRGPEVLAAGERCIVGEIPPLIPAPDNNYMHLFQTPDHVAVLAEYINDARVVPLDGRPHIPAQVRQWLGDARAHWEGDTLVVETRRFRDILGFRNWGADMHLTERFTLIGPDAMSYEFTVDDPETFVTRWTARTTMHRTDKVVYEYACHEHNYSMQGILGGARLKESLAGHE